jgi:hypothetical protein
MISSSTRSNAGVQVPSDVEGQPVWGDGIAAAKPLWGWLSEAAQWIGVAVGQLLSVPFLIAGMMNTTLVTQYRGSANLIWAGVNAAFVGFVFWWLVWLMTREPESWHIGWALFAAITGVAATSVSVHFAVQSMVWLAHHNHAITLKPAQSVLAMKDLYGKALYEILDAVPILKIPATIGWEDPIPDPAAWGGIIFLLLKLVVIVLLAGIFSRLWRVTRKLRWNHRGQSEVFVDDGDGAGPPGEETAELVRNDPGAKMPEPAERIDAESDRS